MTSIPHNSTVVTLSIDKMKTALIPFLLLVLVPFASAQDDIAQEVLAGQLKTLKATKPGEPAILRLDLELEDLVARAKKLPDARQVAFLAAGLSPQRGLYAEFGMPDLTEFAKLLLGKARYPKVNLHRDGLAGRDLSQEIRQAYEKCAEAHRKPLPHAPLYKVAFGYQLTTNARLQGVDRNLGRHIVILNRSALTPGRHWDSAIIHESWHCFQDAARPRTTLLQRAIHEGVATHLTQVVDPTLDDPTAMLWTRAEWNAAEKHREAIVKAFAGLRNSVNRAEHTPYLILGKRPAAVPGAPTRTGYYVGLLACRAWQKANPEKGPADLLAASAEEIWSAFQPE